MKGATSGTGTVYPTWVHPGFSAVRVTRSINLCVYLVDRFLSFCTFSFSHCVLCFSSTYGIWLPLWYIQTLLLTKFNPATPYWSGCSHATEWSCMSCICITGINCASVYTIFVLNFETGPAMSYYFFLFFILFCKYSITILL